MATVKQGGLLFLPIANTTTSTGAFLPAVHIARADGDSPRYHTSDRDAYSGVRAYWHDPKRGNRRNVLVGQSGSQAAEGRLYERGGCAGRGAGGVAADSAGAATKELTLALGQPLVMPQTPVRVTGWKPQIDGTDWLVVKVSHSMSADGAFTTRVELETNAATAPDVAPAAGAEP